MHICVTCWLCCVMFCVICWCIVQCLGSSWRLLSVTTRKYRRRDRHCRDCWNEWAVQVLRPKWSLRPGNWTVFGICCIHAMYTLFNRFYYYCNFVWRVLLFRDYCKVVWVFSGLPKGCFEPSSEWYFYLKVTGTVTEFLVHLTCNLQGYHSQCGAQDLNVQNGQNCRDHTGGLHCNVCAAGYYSLVADVDRLYCQPCACPMTDSANKWVNLHQQS